jgi:hypothetical protein
MGFPVAKAGPKTTIEPRTIQAIHQLANIEGTRRP